MVWVVEKLHFCLNERMGAMLRKPESYRSVRQIGRKNAPSATPQTLGGYLSHPTVVVNHRDSKVGGGDDSGDSVMPLRVFDQLFITNDVCIPFKFRDVFLFYPIRRWISV